MIRALFCVLLCSTPALAEVSQAAVDQAVDAFRNKDFREALTRFKALVGRAEGAALRARLQFNIARCHEELGQPREAIDAFETFLASGGEPALRERARESIATLRAQIGGRVAVTCGAGVRSVALAGRGRAQPCPAEFAGLPAGEALVVATGTAGTTQRFPVRVIAGETVPLRVDIAGGVAPRPDLGDAAPIDPWPWVVLASGVAVTGVGLGFYISNQDNLDALREDPGNQSLRDQVDSDRAFALTGYVLGGALVAGGLVWLLWPDGDDTTASAPGAPFAWTW